MQRFRANSRVPCMRSRCTRRRPAKASTFALKCRACPLGLGILELGLARHRDNTERGDTVALTAQHAKAEAMEGEALAALGDRARFVNDEARHRGCLFIG